MKKIFYSLIILLVFSNSIIAQEDENPIRELSKRLYENEMLANRFLRDFSLAKSKVFKAKIMKDFDQSLARFDDNISYVSMHLPEDKNVRNKFMKLQGQWNIFRMAILDISRNNYKKLVNSTLMMEKECKTMREDILKKHPKYSDNKKVFKYIDYVVDNSKKVDLIITNYILKNQLGFPEIDNAIKVDFSAVKKNLKKLSKDKQLQQKSNLKDLYNSLEMIENTFNKKDSPKLLYSNTKYFSKKNYLLFYDLIQQLQN